MNPYEKYKDIKFNFFKILSTAFHNKKLIDTIYRSKTNMYISTGVADIKEIKKKGINYPKVNFIHTSLSDKAKDANILAINTMKKHLKNEVSLDSIQKITKQYLQRHLSPHILFFSI